MDRFKNQNASIKNNLEGPGVEAGESEVHGTELYSMDSFSPSSTVEVMTFIKRCCDLAHR